MLSLATGLGLLASCATSRETTGSRYVSPRYIPMGNQYILTLREISRNPIVVDNIQKANRENTMSQEQILEADRAWRAAGDEPTPEMQRVQNNDAAKYLVSLNQRHPEFVELFLIDNKGCVTAENLRTTDYWQGDEDKWTKIFNGTKGNYFVDEIEYDLSSRLYLHHYSMPVMDRQDQLIGVLVVGIEVQ